MKEKIAMANVKGPLFSLEAVGSIAKCITYKRSARGSIARKFSKPSGLPSRNQFAVRALNYGLSKSWPSLSDDSKASWTELAATLKISPFAAYFQKNSNLWFSGQRICARPEYYEWGTPTGGDFLGGSTNDGRLLGWISVDDYTYPVNWLAFAWIVSRGETLVKSRDLVFCKPLLSPETYHVSDLMDNAYWNLKSPILASGLYTLAYDFCVEDGMYTNDGDYYWQEDFEIP
jgi:hypothetical protein